MSDSKNNTGNSNHNSNDTTPEPTRGDRLDTLLRSWHTENAQAARDMRDELLHHVERDAMIADNATHSRGILARIGVGRLISAAAIVMLGFLLATLFVKNTEKSAFATGGVAQVAEGGELVALDADGTIMGPCPLQHTDVAVEITGPFARTVVEQVYANPYPRTIEAVYTFPLSNRAAVDRMTMIVKSASGEKVVEGEVKERELARAIYEDARDSGYVASLLEQERPNIFTQSVANLEPGATVRIRIATIELIERKDGVSSYAFPMVVGPRYVPGASSSMPTLPVGWSVREGVVLRGPARVEPETGGALPMARLTDLLERGLPVRAAKIETVDELLALGEGVRFTAHYANGSGERGIYFASYGIGEINGRFFYAPLGKDQGTGFASDTDQVPDASRITPSPTRPPERAGHDISVRVTLDTGGSVIGAVTSELHEVAVVSPSNSTRTITLVDAKTIPNRDFILRWESKDDSIEPGFFAHVSDSTDASAKGGYFALMLEPPARVAPAVVRPRELIFVLDVSGSMNGFPIEKSKDLARKAIAKMRTTDTFNIITFAGATSMLWPEPRLASEENRNAADAYVAGAYGAGGTEMMTAINAALVQPGRSGIAPAKLLELPADGRNATVIVSPSALSADGKRWKISAGNAADGTTRFIAADISVALPTNSKQQNIILDGAWSTVDADRVFVTRSARFEDTEARTRIVFMLTDAFIANDQAIVQAVRDNARASRVFSFGIGNSVNRFLLEDIARAGRGTCDIVTLQADADAVVDRLVRRIESPVLTDIELAIDPALGIHDLLPGGDHLPDLYDQQPIVLIGRFDHAASGSITLRGRTGAGAWERTIQVNLPAIEATHDVVKTLWARAKVDELLLPKLAAVESQSLDAPTKRAVIRLGEAFHIATPYTSFIAVEKSRIVIGGKPMLVSVPVELPDGTNWAGFFGEGVRPADALMAEGRRTRGFEALQGNIESFEQKVNTEWFFDRAVGSEVLNELTDDFKEERKFSLSLPLATGAEVAPSSARLPNLEPMPVSSAPPSPVVSAAVASAPVGDLSKAEADKIAPPGRGMRRDALGPISGKRSAGGEDPSSAVSGGKSQEGKDKSSESAQFGLTTNGPRGTLRGGLGEREPGGGGMGGGASAAPNAGGSAGAVDPVTAKPTTRDPSAQRGTHGQEADGSTVTEVPLEEMHRPTSADEEQHSNPSEDLDAAGVPAPSASLTSTQRDQLVRVLERRLVFVALADLLDEKALIPGLIVEFDLPVAGSDATLKVAIKLRVSTNGVIDPKTLAALRALGVTIDGEDAARGFIVARISADKLIAAALVAGVSRIEPLLEQKAE